MSPAELKSVNGSPNGVRSQPSGTGLVDGAHRRACVEERDRCRGALAKLVDLGHRRTEAPPDADREESDKASPGWFRPLFNFPREGQRLRVPTGAFARLPEGDLARRGLVPADPDIGLRPLVCRKKED